MNFSYIIRTRSAMCNTQVTYQSADSWPMFEVRMWEKNVENDTSLRAVSGKLTVIGLYGLHFVCLLAMTAQNAYGSYNLRYIACGSHACQANMMGTLSSQRA